MAIVVVGGHTRNIGKTSVMAGLIAAMPEKHWTAFKITQFGHGVCSANGEPCDCETADHTIAVSEERGAGKWHRFFTLPCSRSTAVILG